MKRKDDIQQTPVNLYREIMTLKILYLVYKICV